MCSKTIELEVCGVNTSTLLIKLKGRLGGSDISINLWLCALILGGCSQASHIPMVQYLLYGSTANF